jgi:hypothetical protein
MTEIFSVLSGQFSTERAAAPIKRRNRPALIRPAQSEQVRRVGVLMPVGTHDPDGLAEAGDEKL